MEISYDYEGLIMELKEDVDDGNLIYNEVIQILRSSEPIGENYYPIIEWWYGDPEMDELLKIKDEEDIDEVLKLRKAYEKTKPFLEKITVQRCLMEMEQWNNRN